MNKKDELHKSEQKYFLKKLQEFNNKFDKIMLMGYKPLFDINSLPKIIDLVSTWYLFKYPDNFFDAHNRIEYIKENYNKLSLLSSGLTMEQMFFRLPIDELKLVLYCKFKGQFTTIKPGEDQMLVITLKPKERNDFPVVGELYETMIYFSSITGKIIDIISPQEIKYNKNTNILDLFETLKKMNYYDLTEMDRLLFTHECDLYFRKEIIKLIAINIIYSKYSRFGNKLNRAKLFIDEMNDEFGHIIDFEEILKDLKIDISPSEFQKTDDHLTPKKGIFQNVGKNLAPKKQKIKALTRQFHRIK